MARPPFRVVAQSVSLQNQPNTNTNETGLPVIAIRGASWEVGNDELHEERNFSFQHRAGHWVYGRRLWPLDAILSHVQSAAEQKIAMANRTVRLRLEVEELGLCAEQWAR